jgi:hypothetical protein
MSGEDGRRGRINGAPAHNDVQMRQGHIHKAWKLELRRTWVDYLLVSSDIRVGCGVIEMDSNSGSSKIKSYST